MVVGVILVTSVRGIISNTSVRGSILGPGIKTRTHNDNSLFGLGMFNDPWWFWKQVKR